MAAAYLKAPGFEMVQRCRKVPFASRREGLQVAGQIIKRQDVQRGNGFMNVYKCPICSSFHLGHRPF